MNRRRRTLKCDSFYNSSAHSRLSTPELAATPLAFDPQHIVREILHSIFTQTEQEIEQQRSANISSQSLLAQLDKGFENWYYLEQLAYEPHTLSVCESEPRLSGQSQRLDNSTRRMLKRDEDCKRIIAKSKTCDIGQWESRQKIERQQMKTQRVSQKQLVSLMENSRNSENEDRSEEIQSLLRRKKELQMESKQPQSLPSDTGRCLFVEKNERKYFWQDDEGGAVELLYQLKPTIQHVPVIKLGNIKILSGQQLAYPSNIKRRPIVQQPTRKTKRRKEVGDTCILIEQLYEIDGGFNHETIIEQACRKQKGVRIEAKDKVITSAVKLPILR